MAENGFDRIILASASPRRHDLLNQIQLEHTVEVSDVEEHIDESLTPCELVKSLSYQKARAVADCHKNENVAVIGADTVVVSEGAVLGKPAGAEEAGGMLRKLSGNTHCVITGVTVICPADDRFVTEAVETSVTFADMSGEDIQWYVSSGEPMDKAGAYGIQGLGAKFVESISGDFYNVVGLPVRKVSAMLDILGGK